MNPREAKSFAERTAQAAFEEGHARGVADVTEWMRLHLSGISAPNERDFEDMKAWIADRRLSPRRQDACTRCGHPLGLPAFREPTTDGERHVVCPEPMSPKRTKTEGP